MPYAQEKAVAIAAVREAAELCQAVRAEMASAMTGLRNWFSSYSLVGWAGPASTVEDAAMSPALAISATPDDRVDGDLGLLSIASALEALAGTDRDALVACVERGFAVRDEPA